MTDPSDVLLQAFIDGNVEAAYQASLELSKAYHEALLEGSKLRFRLNFGTDACLRCEGLKAGPGVAATCFQVQRCDYTNVKEGEEDLHHRRLIDLLTRRSE